MDSFFINKVVGWVLFTAVLVFGLQALADVVYHADKPEKKGMAVEVAAADSHAAEPAEEEKQVPIGELLASASADAGAKLFKKCKSCHDPAKGGKSKVGPPLWDVVDRKIAHIEGFKYSSSLEEKSGNVWDYDHLDHFLHKPKDYAKNTKMSFPGFKKAKDRADIIVYLRSLSDSPKPLPGQ